MFIYIIVVLLGTIFASFLHLYVERTLKGESIITPRSHCDYCNHVLKWYEMIPVLSFIMQRGRCNKCSKKLDISMFFTELITGLLFLLVYIIYGFTYKTILGFIIVLIMISICLSDFKSMIILDSTLLVGIILTYFIIYLDLGIWDGIYKSFLYGIFAFVLMFIIKIIGDAIFKRESLGGGDIKLAFLMGSILPYNLFLVSLIASSSIALPYALYVSKKNQTNELPFGPFLMMGLFITFLFQDNILELLSILTS